MTIRHVEFTEPQVCAICGSGNVKVVGMKRARNIVLIYLCRDCDEVFFETYAYDSKGVMEDDD